MRILFPLALVMAMAAPALALDLNRDDAATLQREGGLSPRQAQAVIDYRDRHGPFHNLGELRDVPGMDRAAVNRLRQRHARLDDRDAEHDDIDGPGHESGEHEAGDDGGHDAGHDSGHDSGHDGGHDSGHGGSGGDSH